MKVTQGTRRRHSTVLVEVVLDQLCVCMKFKPNNFRHIVVLSLTGGVGELSRILTLLYQVACIKTNDYVLSLRLLCGIQ